jgi:hypothetical protein
LVVDRPSSLVCEQQRDQAARGLLARIGRAGADVRQFDRNRGVLADVLGEHDRDLVVEVDIANRSRLWRGKVEPVVRGLVEAELLGDVDFAM